MPTIRHARSLLGLLALQLVSACSDAPTPPPTPGADTTAPTTQASTKGGTYAGAQSVTLTCDDGVGGSGCAATYYTLDGSTPTRESTAYAAALSVAPPSTLKFFSVDKAGNAEAVRTEQYIASAAPDTQAPVTAASPAGGTYTSARTVTLTCTDAGGSGCAGTYYTLDGSTPTAASARYTAPVAVAANAKLRFFSVDAADNAEAAQAEVYLIDGAAPATVASPAGGIYGSARSVTLACSDGADGSGCADTYYTLDGSVPTSASAHYTGPVDVAASATLRFFSVDAAGNAEGAHAEAYLVDGQPPVVTASPAGGVYGSARQVTLACDDGAAGSGCVGIRYTTDGSAPTSASPTYTAPLAVSASTTLRFVAEDAAGNASAVGTEDYVIDTQAPVVTASPAGGTYGAAQDVTLTCADGAGGSGCAGIFYTTDGSVPTAGSARYTGPVHVSASTTLRFLAQDAAGNTSDVRTESYVVDTQAPVTTASPAGGSYPGPVEVTLSCTDSGAGCDATYFTTDGSAPTTGSARYTAPLQMGASATLRFFSVDAAGNAEAVRVEAYALPRTPAETSAQLAAVRATTNGSGLSLPVERAVVTYVKPLVGDPVGDAAGFFLQAEQQGPALFVVDPGGLSPAPQVGDRVSLVVTQKGTSNGQPRVLAFSGWSREAGGVDVAALRQDGSVVDLAAQLAAYDSEALAVSGTIAGAFSGSGTGHVQAPFVTLGVPAATTNLRLRVVSTVQDALDLTPDCALTVTAPLWRFNAVAQASAWTAQDVVVHGCPAPKVTSVQVVSPTQLNVRFDRRLDAATVLASGDQFTFDTGLTASAAVVTDREVRLTTSSQVPGTTYQLGVSETVKDTRGTGVDPSARTSFVGYSPPAVLRLNEVSPNITNGRDLVELVVVTSGSTAGFTLVQDAATPVVLATFPAVTVTAGDIIVVHLNPLDTNGDAPQSETVSPSQFPQSQFAANYDTAWDFRGGTSGITYSSQVLRVKDPAGVTQDAAPFIRTTGTPPSAFLGLLQNLQADGQWLPSNCGGALCTYATSPTANEVSVDWSTVGTSRTGATVYRSSGTDTNTDGDWVNQAPNTLGLPNF